MSNVDDAGYVTESTTSADNYVLIKVPSHGTDTFYYNGATSVSMTSYLRIGAVPSDDPSQETGWDFAKLVVGFNDDTRTRPDDYTETKTGDVVTAITAQTASQSLDSVLSTTSPNGSTTDTTWYNKTETEADEESEGPAGTMSFNSSRSLRTRMQEFYGETDGKTLKVTDDQASRITESTKLHYRGGWRDHSDGNRITTTRGDKVEIIRGNYKMIVLGRRPEVEEPIDTVDNSMGTHDHSGGVAVDWDDAPGSYTEVSWVKIASATSTGSLESASDGDGVYYTWRISEETVKGDVLTTYHGNVNDRYYGPSVSSYVGWEKAPDDDTGTRAENDGTDPSIPSLYRENPTLNRENPAVYEETWAKSITEKTWAKSIESYTGTRDKPVPSIKSETYASSVYDYTRVDGDGKVTTKVHGSIDDYFDYQSGTYFSEYHGGIAGEQWYGQFGEVFFGGCESFKLGVFTDVRIGAKIAEVNISVPGSLATANIAPRILNIDLAWTKTDILLGNTLNEVMFCFNHYELNTGFDTKFQMTGKQLALAFFLC